MSDKIVDDLSSFYPPALVDNDFGSEQGSFSTDSSTVEIEDLFKAGVEAILLTLSPISSSIDDIKHNTETLTEIRDILKEQNTGANPAISGSGGKSREEIELEAAKLDLRNREFEYRKIKNAEEEERRQRAEEDVARKRRDAQFEQFMSSLPKKTEEIFRNPLNLVPGLGKLLFKGIGLAGRGIGSLAKRPKRSSSSSTETSETITESTEPVESPVSEESSVISDSSEAIGSVPEPTEDIIDAEYYIEDDTGPAPLGLPSPDMLALPSPDNLDVIDAEYSIAGDSGLVDSGAAAEAEEANDVAFEANSLLADTLEAPGDSEFVEALTEPMTSASGASSGGGMGDLGKGLLAASIAAILAPNMDRIFDIVEDILDFFEDKLYPDVLKPIANVVIKVLDGVADAFITFFNITAPKFGDMIGSIADLVTNFNKGLLPHMEKIGSALGEQFTTFIEVGTSLIQSIGQGLIDLITNPVDTLSELGTALGSMVSSALLSLVVPLSEELEVMLKKVLPEALGGYDKKTKERLSQGTLERVEARHESYNTVFAGGMAIATGGEYQVESMLVYAANVEFSRNEGSSATAGSSSVSKTTNNVTIVEKTTNSRTVPGGW